MVAPTGRRQEFSCAICEAKTTHVRDNAVGGWRCCWCGKFEPDDVSVSSVIVYTVLIVLAVLIGASMVAGMANK